MSNLRAGVLPAFVRGQASLNDVLSERYHSLPMAMVLGGHGREEMERPFYTA